MSIESIPVYDYMIRNVKTENEYQNIHAACKVMHENDIGQTLL